ncbi:hypothetical protein IGB42_02855 [Andreprevotia sp. IGB-42]|uniref:hypothetical protein n=1 Tax=Andreprevotia sp. IGB-42 TaxID=2497473 RepID=UPI00135A3A8D|nr:hypothetical protein [Andreprevotia sp. IGB-42]KAF0812566.1 hypothetical protein IGB42_02855 [Andreprevotia sp. IGB-42]
MPTYQRALGMWLDADARLQKMAPLPATPVRDAMSLPEAEAIQTASGAAPPLLPAVQTPMYTTAQHGAVRTPQPQPTGALIFVPERVLNRNGEPFSRAALADLYARAFGLSATHRAVAAGDGFMLQQLANQVLRVDEVQHNTQSLDGDVVVSAAMLPFNGAASESGFIEQIAHPGKPDHTKPVNTMPDSLAEADIAADAYGFTPGKAMTVDEASIALAKATGLRVDLFGGKKSKIGGAINVDIEAMEGVRADLTKGLGFLPAASSAEITAFNPFISDRSAMFANDRLAEALRVLKPGGEMVIAATKGNSYVKLGKFPSEEQLNLMGFDPVEYKAPLTAMADYPARFGGVRFSRTDGMGFINPDDMIVIVLRRKP